MKISVAAYCNILLPVNLTEPDAALGKDHLQESKGVSKVNSASILSYEGMSKVNSAILLP